MNKTLSEKHSFTMVLLLLSLASPTSTGGRRAALQACESRKHRQTATHALNEKGPALRLLPDADHNGFTKVCCSCGIFGRLGQLAALEMEHQGMGLKVASWAPVSQDVSNRP